MLMVSIRADNGARHTYGRRVDVCAMERRIGWWRGWLAIMAPGVLNLPRPMPLSMRGAMDLLFLKATAAPPTT